MHPRRRYVCFAMLFLEILTTLKEERGEEGEAQRPISASLEFVTCRGKLSENFGSATKYSFSFYLFVQLRLAPTTTCRRRRRRKVRF